MSCYYLSKRICNDLKEMEYRIILYYQLLLYHRSDIFHRGINSGKFPLTLHAKFISAMNSILLLQLCLLK